jgi:RsiW-degrading membrane proteinase PrsW (M82 family)
MEILTSPVLLSFIFGFGPPLVWLILWLQEDAIHPEPRSAIIKTFLLGGFSVLLAILLEGILQFLIPTNILVQFLSWAIIEEGLKLSAVVFALHYLAAPIDEPIDWIIYMITAALGFAAVENILFLLQPFNGPILFEGLVVSNLRFIGATVLHLIASAAHGAALAFCYYKSRQIKHYYYVIGFTIAVIVHLAFNLFLTLGQNYTWTTLLVFAGVWLLLLPLILIFEKVKTLSADTDLL